MNKELIKRRFERCLKTYDANAAVQDRMAQKLISMLNHKEYPEILEIGCGTGLLTRYAVKNLSYNSYSACDIVPKCEEYIKSIDSKILFTPCDVDSLFNDRQSYDLIISNAVFQWLDDTENVIKNIIRKLNPDGVLIFSTFGTQNFSEVFQAAGKGLVYYSIEDWKKKLTGLKFTIEKEIIRLNFETPADVLRHMKNTGVNSLSNMAWKKTDLFKFEYAYNNICNNAPTLTYNPIYIKLENILK